ncbi:extracellular solute-binding protein [Solirhodobacter olei]|uniref:extracellular solute-binding protein n=1 Tax=Solirhodobacter olei TaxID=2493082 RepID=UPI000FDAF983|nr:extracellular solute-binding protein [Solirhodobacter olei]
MLKRFLPVATAMLVAFSLPAHAAQTLVLYSSGPGSLAKALAKGFEHSTGTKVELYTASTGKVVARLSAEKGNPKADVVILANWTAGLALADQQPVETFRPEDIVKTLRPSLDAAGPFLPIGGDTVSILVNTKKVSDPSSLTDWFALNGKAWDDRVTMPNPLLSGTASDFVLAFQAEYGQRAWDYFNALKAEGTIWPGPNAAALRPVELGARSAMLSAVGHTSLKAKAKGNALDLVFPKTGTVLIPRPIFILKSAHNMDAAKAFVRYSMSPAGQKLVSKALLIPAAASVEPAKIWPDLSSVKFIHADWTKLAGERAKVLAKFRKDVLGQ